jgi:hypothetical protein
VGAGGGRGEGDIARQAHGRHEPGRVRQHIAVVALAQEFQPGGRVRAPPIGDGRRGSR